MFLEGTVWHVAYDFYINRNFIFSNVLYIRVICVTFFCYLVNVYCVYFIYLFFFLYIVSCVALTVFCLCVDDLCSVYLSCHFFYHIYYDSFVWFSFPLTNAGNFKMAKYWPINWLGWIVYNCFFNLVSNIIAFTLLNFSPCFRSVSCLKLNKDCRHFRWNICISSPNSLKFLSGILVYHNDVYLVLLSVYGNADKMHYV